MGKRILGILMIVLGIILAIPLPKEINTGIDMVRDPAVENSYAFGYIFGQVLIGTACYFLIRYGLKFQKKKLTTV
jgi:hypothetical protein